MDGNEMAEMLLKKKKVGSIKKMAKKKRTKKKMKKRAMKKGAMSVMAGGY